MHNTHRMQNFSHTGSPAWCARTRASWWSTVFQRVWRTHLFHSLRKRMDRASWRTLHRFRALIHFSIWTALKWFRTRRNSLSCHVNFRSVFLIPLHLLSFNSLWARFLPAVFKFVTTSSSCSDLFSVSFVEHRLLLGYEYRPCLYLLFSDTSTFVSATFRHEYFRVCSCL